MSRYTCFFTGHRQIPSLVRPRLIKDLETTLKVFIDGGITEFIAGGALGFDTLAAEMVLALRDKHPAVSLSLILPCRDQDKFWTPAQKRTYARILEAADSKTFLFDQYVNGCMQMRNRAMADRSQACIAYYNGRKGGTAYTVRYAREKGVRIVFVPAKEESIWEV